MRDDGGVSPEMSRADSVRHVRPERSTTSPGTDVREGRPGGGRATVRGWPATLARAGARGRDGRAAGLALSQAAATALRAESSPVEAVGAAVRDFTPGPIAVFLVHLVGSQDKPLLLGGTALVVLAICGYAASLDAPLPAAARPGLLRAHRDRPGSPCSGCRSPGIGAGPGADRRPDHLDRDAAAC